MRWAVNRRARDVIGALGGGIRSEELRIADARPALLVGADELTPADMVTDEAGAVDSAHDIDIAHIVPVILDARVPLVSAAGEEASDMADTVPLIEAALIARSCIIDC